MPLKHIIPRQFVPRSSCAGTHSPLLRLQSLSTASSTTRTTAITTTITATRNISSIPARPRLNPNPSSGHRHTPPQPQQRRTLTTLPDHPYYYIHPHPTHPSTSVLTLLPTTPPTPTLSLGTFPTSTTTTTLPTLQTFQPNPHLLPHLHHVLSLHSPSDPTTQSLAHTFATSTHTSLLQSRLHNKRSSAGGSSPAAPTQTGGWIHISDLRCPPEWGRIPDPEDIFGSLEVGPEGGIRVGSYQPCIGYRIWTRNGVMQLPPYLREKLKCHLLDEEKRINTGAAEKPAI